MSARLRIAIVGFGIAGASLAIRLGRQGHAIDVFERGGEVQQGAGLLLAPPALSLFGDLGLEDAARSLGAVVYGLRAMDARGAVLRDWDARRHGHEALGLGIERRALHELLKRAAAMHATVHFGLGIEAADPESGWLTDCTGMQRGPYDLVLASDGAVSRLRTGAPSLVARSHRYRWNAFTCLMRCAAEDVPRSSMVQRFRGAQHASIWPVGPANGEGQVVCVSVNVPGASAPHFATVGYGLAELARLQLADHAMLETLQPIGSWIALSCHDIALRRLVRGRLAFVGDAAHCLSPQLGQGARLALAGAACLERALVDLPPGAALARYDREQRALARRYQRWGRWLTPLFQSPRREVQWLRDHVVAPASRLAVVERGVLSLLCGSG